MPGICSMTEVMFGGGGLCPKLVLALLPKTVWLYPISQAWFLEALGAAHFVHRALSARRELLASHSQSSSQVVSPLPTPFLFLDLNHFFHTLLEGHTGCFYPMVTCGLSAGC